MKGEDNIDYERWYRELFKKFTTIRDEIENTTDDMDMLALIDFAQKILQEIKGSTDRSSYESASMFVNILFRRNIKDE